MSKKYFITDFGKGDWFRSKTPGVEDFWIPRYLVWATEPGSQKEQVIDHGDDLDELKEKYPEAVGPVSIRTFESKLGARDTRRCWGCGEELKPGEKYFCKKCRPYGATGKKPEMETKVDRAIKMLVNEGLHTSEAEYLDYLKNTLIPDLKDSGSEATAEDFEEIVKNLEAKTYDEEFVDYLENTLIPDLWDSGKGATAEDFEQGVYFMEEYA